MKSAASSSSPAEAAPPNFVYGTVCRVNLWTRITMTLALTQIVIGVSSAVLFLVASRFHLIAGYCSIGMTTSFVIFSAGCLGMLASKRKAKIMIISFLVTSCLAAGFSLFSIVVGIVGASRHTDDRLLVPIAQLVCATVEILVATWSVGICCQAICCPEATFRYIRMGASSGSSLGSIIADVDSERVVVFDDASRRIRSSFVYALSPNEQGLDKMTKQDNSLILGPNVITHIDPISAMEKSSCVSGRGINDGGSVIGSCDEKEAAHENSAEGDNDSLQDEQAHLLK